MNGERNQRRPEQDRAAFVVWEGRIAPVFDVADRAVIVDRDHVAPEGWEEVELPTGPAFLRAARFLDAGVGTVVCGAISRPQEAALLAYGIHVVPFVAASLEEAVDAWRRGELASGAPGPWAMPGTEVWAGPGPGAFGPGGGAPGPDGSGFVGGPGGFGGGRGGWGGGGGGGFGGGRGGFGGGRGGGYGGGGGGFGGGRGGFGGGRGGGYGGGRGGRGGGRGGGYGGGRGGRGGGRGGWGGGGRGGFGGGRGGGYGGGRGGFGGGPAGFGRSWRWFGEEPWPQAAGGPSAVGVGQATWCVCPTCGFQAALPGGVACDSVRCPGCGTPLEPMQGPGNG